MDTGVVVRAWLMSEVLRSVLSIIIPYPDNTCCGHRYAILPRKLAGLPEGRTRDGFLRWRPESHPSSPATIPIQRRPLTLSTDAHSLEELSFLYTSFPSVQYNTSIVYPRRAYIYRSVARCRNLFIARIKYTST